ncbi:MAG: SMP-30/gluconolactonase/LRE family protein, partial [Novosphingobium sp.]
MKVLAAGQFEKITGGLYLEGLAVARDGASIWYSDVIAGGVRGHDGEALVATLNAERMWTGGLLIDEAGFILSTGQKGIMRTDMSIGASTWLLNSIDGAPINGINEMAPDGAGGIYFGTVDLDAIIKGEAPAAASLYRLAADGVLHLAHGPLGFANGMALSADGQTLFLNESFDGTYAFDVQADRTLANRRKILPKEDCDGMALDVDGNIWVTGFRSPQITRIAPDGTVLELIDTPAQAITQIRFGGADMRDYWITCVPADSGDNLAVGTLPDAEVSFVYQGRS